MKISSSIYSHKGNLKDLVTKLDSYGCDYFHMDCNDDMKIFDTIREIRKYSKTPIDLHIISDDPEKFYDEIEDTKVELVCFQVENLKDDFKFPLDLSGKVGIAIQSKSDLEIIEKYDDDFSFILLMTTIPGQSGGKFDYKDIEIIDKLNEKYPSKAIHLDGGVNDEVARAIRDRNVYCCVSGSYILGAELIFDSIFKLKSDLNKDNHLIKDFMVSVNELPLLKESEIDLKNVLEMITQYKTGSVFVVNDDRNLIGIITDGDIRREILNNLDDLNQIDIKKCLNRNPIIVDKCDSITDVLMKIKQLNKVISFFPVIRHDILVGAISLRQLFNGNYDW